MAIIVLLLLIPIPNFTTIINGQLPFLPLAPQSGTRIDGSITATESDITRTSKSTENKVVIINFDDSHQSDYLYARSILDKYGLKATFFTACGLVEQSEWQNVKDLQNDGMDIQSHTMTHPDLNKLNETQLDYEIGQSRKCLENHGINPTIFAYPYGYGSNNATVVDVVSKYYDLARTNGYFDFANSNSDDFPLAFLQCDANNRHPQNDCRTYSDDGTLTFANRYSLNSWSHVHIEGDYSDTGSCRRICYFYNDHHMMSEFITAVNSQIDYNKDGVLRTIPIIVYHDVVPYPDASYSKKRLQTTVDLFDAEMKYLHDNGFKVITMSDLAYDENNNYLYVKGSIT